MYVIDVTEFWVRPDMHFGFRPHADINKLIAKYPANLSPILEYIELFEFQRLHYVFQQEHN